MSLPAQPTRAWRLAFPLVALLVPAITVWMVIRLGANVPFGDEISMVASYEPWRAGKWSWAGLVAQHNEHRLAVGRLLYAANLWLTHGDHRALMALTLVVQGAFGALLAVRLRRMPSLTAAGTAIGLVAIAWLLFNPAAAEVWLWAFEVVFPISLFAYALGIFTLLEGEPSARRILAASACGLVSSYALGNGVVFWPVMVAIALAQRYPKQLLGLCLLAAGTGLGSYFVGYARATHIDGMPFSPPNAVLYFFAWLGSPMGFHQSVVAVGVGLLAMGLAVAVTVGVVKRWQTPEGAALKPWLFLLPYGLVSALLGALGRSVFGVEQALAGKYIFLASGFWAALLVLALGLAGPRLMRPMVALVLALAGVFGLTNVRLVAAHVVPYQADLALAADLWRWDGYHAQLWARLFPRPAPLAKAGAFLKQHRLPPFTVADVSPIGRPAAALGLAVGTAVRRGAFDRLEPLAPQTGPRRWAQWDAVVAEGWAAPTEPIARIWLLDEAGVVRGVGHGGAASRPDAALSDCCFLTFSGWKAIVHAQGARGRTLRAYVQAPDTPVLRPVDRTHQLR